MFENCNAQKIVNAACVVLFAGLILGVAPGIRAQQAAPPAQGNAPATPVAAEQQPQEGPQILHLMVGRSIVITSPTRIKRVSIADPTIAEALVVSPYQVVVNGKTPGGVSLLLWDDMDQSQAFEVSVDIDILSLTQKIHEVFPNEAVQIESSKDSVILSGHASSAAIANKIIEVVKNAAPKVTSLIEIPPAPPGDVLLEVKFAEVDRTALTQSGFNLLSLPGAKTVGSISTQQYGAPTLTGTLPPTTTTTTSVGTATQTSGSGFTLNNLLNIFIYRPDINLGATIQALQQQDVLQILAEPNVLTASGKDASFLAGGQFPFPVLQSSGGSGYAGITIQFKQYGVKLDFTPTITPEGLIHLKVAPEVSSLDYTNAVTIQGFTIPALSTRRVESEMDLRDGQSFAIAGLIDNQVTKQLSKIPGIGDIPILGKLFQSTSFSKSNSELLVIVTPRIVQAQSLADMPKGPVFPIPFMPPTSAEKPETPTTR
jgi:pilus assembly protein CpaC